MPIVWCGNAALFLTRKGVFRMSYSEHWRREFLTRHPEYESQSQVSSQEAVQPPTPVSSEFPLFTFTTVNSDFSKQLPQQGPRRQHIPTQDRSISSDVLRQVCCLRQRLKLTQRGLANSWGSALARCRTGSRVDDGQADLVGPYYCNGLTSRRLMAAELFKRRVQPKGSFGRVRGEYSCYFCY